MPSSLTNITIPDNVNLIFDYSSNLWQIKEKGGAIPMDEDGVIGALKDWIKPKREYIVELAPNYKSFYDGQCYYSLCPVGGSYGYGMYPIEDGYVLDEKNAMGFGTKVPVETFKQNIRDQINLIKNYGE